MKIRNLTKYLWGFSEEAIKETAEIINNPYHPRYAEKIIIILERCDKPKQIFSIISKGEFIEKWPKIKAKWSKYPQKTNHIAWWQTIYEELLAEYNKKIKTPKGESSGAFVEIGKSIKEKRIKKKISQNTLAIMSGIEQPDISKIEKGEKNITLETLLKLCKVLQIKKIEL